MLEEARSRFEEILRMDGLYDPAEPKKPHLCIRHSESTPSMFFNPKNKRLKCFGCGESWNTFSYLGETRGISDFTEQAELAYQLLGIELTPGQGSGGSSKQIPERRPQPSQAPQMQQPEPAAEGKNYSEYFMRCFGNEDPSRYMETVRGISRETLDEFCIGFNPHYQAAYDAFWQAVIIPIDSHSYVARNIDPNADPKTQRYRKRGSECFNVHTLDNGCDTRPIWVVEGEIDALSIIDAGGRAIALGSTSGVRHFLDVLKVKALPEGLTFIIALDNDASGKKAAEGLKGFLKQVKIPYLDKPITFGKCKDANEYLVTEGREALRLRIKKEEDTLLLADSNGQTNLALMDAFVRSTKTDSVCIPTGIASIDTLLDGGLYPGLYVIGAQPAAGKTALVLQIADNIAQGKGAEEPSDILYFSLEMSRFELIARSISRTTAELGQKRSIEKSNWKTARGIQLCKRYERYSELEKKLIYDSIVEYSQSVAPHFYVHESTANFGTSYIRNEAEALVSKTGKSPVVILDYLQIVPPEAEGKALTEKQNMDRVIVELKRLSRDLNAPVIAISSFNRASYDNAALSSFKESGCIEYTADVVLGLERGRLEGQEAPSPAAITVKVLKNRHGARSNQAALHFYGEFSFFDDLGIEANYSDRCFS